MKMHENLKFAFLKKLYFIKFSKKKFSIQIQRNNLNLKNERNQAWKNLFSYKLRSTFNV